MSRRFGPVGPRRQMEWSRFRRDAAVTGALEHQLLTTPLEVALGRSLADFTVTRIVVSMWFSGGSTLGEFAMGIACDSRDSPTIDPVTDVDEDWMWLENFAAQSPLHETVAGVFNATSVYQPVYRDLGAQRKCSLHHVPYLHLKNRAGAAATVQLTVSTLVKLA